MNFFQVEGPGGTATDSAIVCIASPEDVDYGLDTDEQRTTEVIIPDMAGLKRCR